MNSDPDQPETSKRPRSWHSRGVGLLILALVLTAVPLLSQNSFYIDVATRALLTSITVIGLNILMGYAGQVSLGHAGFYGIGAYASAILTTHFGWSSFAALLAGCGVAGGIAFVVGGPVLRLRGHYLAMATLGMGIIITLVITNESKFTGGPDGMPVPAFSMFGWTISGERVWYAVSAVLLVAVTAASSALVNAPAGRALQALHGSETAARVMGIDVGQFKIRAFVLSAVLASLSGSLSAHYIGFITPNMAGLFYSIELLTMVVMGGMASIYGSIVGATLLTILPQFLTRFEGWETVLLGVVLMFTMMYIPKGLVPTLRQRFRAIRGSSNA